MADANFHRAAFTGLAGRIPLDAARRRSEDLVKKMIGARDST
jgi:hypothetical protein